MNSLEEAISIALKTHLGQLDKGGQAYILHPMRLMMKFTDTKEQILAVLHDVIEDGNISFMYLKSKGFSDDIIQALECLTKRKDEAYEDFILRVATNKLAIKIKIEDIKDNMNLTRLSLVQDKDLNRLKKYHKAFKFLLSLNSTNKLSYPTIQMDSLNKK